MCDESLLKEGDCESGAWMILPEGEDDELIPPEVDFQRGPRVQEHADRIRLSVISGGEQ